MIPLENVNNQQREVSSIPSVQAAGLQTNESQFKALPEQTRDFARSGILPVLNLESRSNQNACAVDVKCPDTSGPADPRWTEKRNEARKHMADEIKQTGQVKVKEGVILWDIADASLRAGGKDKPSNADIMKEMNRLIELNHLPPNCGGGDLIGKTIKVRDDAPPKVTTVEQGKGKVDINLPMKGEHIELGNGDYKHTRYPDGKEKYEFKDGSGCTIEKKNGITEIKHWGKNDEDNYTLRSNEHKSVQTFKDGTKVVSSDTVEKGAMTRTYYNADKTIDCTTTEWPNGDVRTTWPGPNGTTVGRMETTDKDGGKRTVRFGNADDADNFTTVDYKDGSSRRENKDGSGYTEQPIGKTGMYYRHCWGTKADQNYDVIVDAAGNIKKL